ncbi:hypothetical protein [Veillonella sp. CHU110]|uniref:hypothetical protein n=1 Tax=Veillonella sp. CHU110 TaxID=2490947 RepID=UPI000F8CA09E|nr:hypothetical protein [Veillonella sp. CHU110]
MEFGILILIILGSFIFKSNKSDSAETTKPIPSKDMTWEEMEAYYGITLSQDQKEPIEVEADSHTDENLEAAPVTYDPVGLDRYEQSVEVSKNDTLVDRESLRLAARRGMVWSIILEAPKGRMRRYGR